MSKRIAILGLGWLGEPLAKELLKEGYSISGSATSLDKVYRLSKSPYHVARLKVESDKIEGDPQAFFHGANTVVINFPPKRILDIEHVFIDQIKQLIPFLTIDMNVIFVSSTSVYGNTNKWVTEEQELVPEKASGKALLKAEELLREHCGERLTILRLAGLIGPNRHPGKFLANKRELKNANVPVNLIHLVDVIGLIKSILSQKAYGITINGCADEHPERREFYARAADLLGLDAPIFSAETTRSYKLVSNKKSKEVLGYSYQYANPEKIFEEIQNGQIKIVGAGPGDLGLLTIAGYNAIEEADVILHDNLVSTQVLNINQNAEHVYVGRKFGDQSNQSDRQLRINQLLEEQYRKGNSVVRLKSGDPYVYGRAAEEARYLMERNLPFEVIPGISAALAAANQCNIPITERRKSNSILICTAHTADYSFEQLKGIAGLLKAGNTLALYMGLKSLDKVIPKLMEVCQDGSIPVNAISNASRPNQVLLTSTLENIRTDLEQTPLEMPVVFLIGVTPIS
ncbi:MAG: uroporphyrinogen-III C-methyltransferase [Crocinitomicaceae bacterium]|nr:uroporphyrinogen-III C-methyltransferase [Crocinitomicaceae bacterium]